MYRLQQRVRNGVVSADRDQPVDRMRAVRRPEQLAGPSFDRGQRLGDGVGVAGDVACICELQVGERLHVELRMVLRAESPRCLPHGHRTEAGTGTEADAAVERRAEYRNITPTDIA